MHMLKPCQSTCSEICSIKGKQQKGLRLSTGCDENGVIFHTVDPKTAFIRQKLVSGDTNETFGNTAIEIIKQGAIVWKASRGRNGPSQDDLVKSGQISPPCQDFSPEISRSPGRPWSH